MNRLWAHYLGRGLVDPVDDLRLTNPAANEPLLAALAKHFTDVEVRPEGDVTRTILNSRVYQLAGRDEAANADDEQNFSHATTKAMPAEVLLDAICQTTGVPEKYNGMPGRHRAPSRCGTTASRPYFLAAVRPAGPHQRVRVRAERPSPSIAQALHLMNAEEIEAKIRSRKGTARKLADSEMTPTAIVDELCLSTHGRFPTKAERESLVELFSGKEALTRREATEDALWTLLNTKDFLYNR